MMSLATENTEFVADDEYVGEYRALSALAVTSVVLGVCSAAAVLDWSLALFPLAGIVFGIWALVRIRRNSETLTGAKIAKIGLALSILGWAGGWSWLTYDYLTEVPPGYERISYADLQADATGTPVPAAAKALDGKRVFIKGYVYPGAQTQGIQRFVLVRDNGTCCFGGAMPKLNDMVDVKLSDPLRIVYATGVFRVAGTFRVQSTSAPGLGEVLYQLDADYVK
ncbi:MAG: DUF3299 domain-containing protein [Pirellulales bacterium]|nr:DUF3299 domain-containing protein [Pirellulales bacterium]